MHLNVCAIVEMATIAAGRMGIRRDFNRENVASSMNISFDCLPTNEY